MLDHYLYLSNVVLTVVCLLFALVFITLPSVNAKQLSNYRKSLWVLSVSYSLVGGIILFQLCFDIVSVDFISSVFIGVSLSQACLFTVTLDNLLNPAKITTRFVLRQCIPLFVFLLMHIVLVPFWGYPLLTSIEIWKNYMFHPVILLREVSILFYMAQIVYYFLMLFREEREYNQRINNYSADTIEIQLSWVKYGFMFAAIIGLLSLVTTLMAGELFEFSFNILLIIFYSYFALRFIRYPYIFENVKDLFQPPPAPVEIQEQEELKPDLAKRYNWEAMRAQIIEKQYYLQSGITIDVIAAELGIGRVILSSLINSEESVNFNFWINQLRIAEAQRLLNEDPEITLADVAERVGYTEQSNFSRQFKLHTQMSPSAWRSSQSIL